MSIGFYINELAKKDTITKEDIDILLKLCPENKLIQEINEFVFNVFKNYILCNCFDKYRKKIITAYRKNSFHDIHKLIPRRKFLSYVKQVKNNEEAQNKLIKYYDNGIFYLIDDWIKIKILDGIIEQKIIYVAEKIFLMFRRLCENKLLHEILSIAKQFTGEHFYILQYRNFPTTTVQQSYKPPEQIIRSVEDESKHMLNNLHIKLHQKLSERLLNYKECTCYDLNTVKLKEIGIANGKLREEMKKVGIETF